MPLECQLSFMHPQYGTTFQAWVPLDYTALDVLDLLQEVGFLAPDETYALGFYAEELQDDKQLKSIEDLQDGDILRVIVKTKADLAPPPSPSLIEQHLVLLPDGRQVQLHFQADQDSESVLSQLIQAGFLYAEHGPFELQIRGRETWPQAKTLGEMQLPQPSLIRCLGPNCPKEPSLPEVQNQLQQELQQLQTSLSLVQEQLALELNAIRQAIPKPYVIPLDYEKASLNPTQFPYRNLDSLLNEIRATQKLPALKKISTRHWLPYVLGLLLVLGLAAPLVYFFFVQPQ